MRLFLFFIILAIGSLHAKESYSQTARVDLNMKDVPVKEVLRQIEEKSDFFFLYNSKLIDVEREVTVVAINQKIDEILKQIFRQSDVVSTVIDKQIVLTNKSNQLGLSILKEGSQQIVVTGTVKDAITGAALPGVNIQVQGTTQGTITDLNGEFSLKVPSANATLIFSFIGYLPETIAIDGRNNLEVILVEDVKSLEEVVVVGYGSTRKKDVTGALAVISSKDFTGKSNTQFGSAMQGKVAGVQISKPSGQPQAGFNIRIRGTSTLTAGSEPLYIVDGVPTASIHEISPGDLENITILKDASSASIYGASGSNGVVLITTKRGSNQPTKVTFNASAGVSSIWKKMDVLDATQYKALMTEMGQTTDWSQYPYNKNWQDEVFRTAHTQSYQLAVTGGNEQTKYYLSGTYLDQEGIVITNMLERYTFKANVDHKVNSWFKVGSSISYNKWKDVDVSESRKYGSVMATLTGAPVTDVYNADGTFVVNPFIQDLENPVALILKNDHKYQNYRFNGNVYMEANLFKDLKFKTMFGFEQLNGIYNAWVNPVQSREGRSFKGIADLANSQSAYWISENTLTYNKTVENHSLNVMAGFVASSKISDYSSINAKGFGSPAVHTVNAGTIKTSDADFSERKNTAVLSRVNYTYNDRYLLTMNFRADASSVFGANHKWGYFPSFSFGWRASEESFLKNANLFRDLKFRAGWGKVGNDQIGDYASYGIVGPGSFYVWGEKVVPGTSIRSLENEDLRWETTNQTNFGIDVTLNNDRISMVADYYTKETTDMLLNSPIPASVGVPGSTATKNVGSMENKGFEFQISSRNLVSQFKWNTEFNISFNKSKITKLDKGVPIRLGDISQRGMVAIAKEGEELGLFYGYVSEGVDPATGDIIYSDLDKDGKLSDGDMTIIGNSNPKFSYGLTNSFSYKNFTFSFFFQGVQGNDLFNASRIETEGLFDEANQLTTVLNRWVTPGQVTDIPRIRFGETRNSLISSRYVEDGSFLRLKSATLGFDMPDKILKKLKISKLYLYVTGENLLTFTNYSGFDPEVNVYGRGAGAAMKNIAPGVDYGTYPQTRDFLLGINITF